MMVTLFFWAVFLLVCLKVYPELQDERPGWGMRAEWFMIGVAVTISSAVAMALMLNGFS